MNHIGKIPVLETSDGAIFESNAIARCGEGQKKIFLWFSLFWCRYLVWSFGCCSCRRKFPLWGQIEQWIDFSSFEIDANLKGIQKTLLDWSNHYSRNIQTRNDSLFSIHDGITWTLSGIKEEMVRFKL